MEIKKLLTIFVVFLAVLAAMSTIIEAQRGGGHGGGMGGGHHWSVNAGSDNNNVGDNNNAGYVEVYVSTDKRMYVLGEPIEITVTAYNPTDFTLGLEFPRGPPQAVGCQASYSIDGIYPRWGCDDVITYANVPPRGSVSWQFTHTEEYPGFQVTEGRHTIVGILYALGGYYYPQQSMPITIRVVDPNNSGM